MSGNNECCVRTGSSSICRGIWNFRPNWYWSLDCWNLRWVLRSAYSVDLRTQTCYASIVNCHRRKGRSKIYEIVGKSMVWCDSCVAWLFSSWPATNWACLGLDLRLNWTCSSKLNFSSLAGWLSPGGHSHTKPNSKLKWVKSYSIIWLKRTSKALMIRQRFLVCHKITSWCISWPLGQAPKPQTPIRFSPKITLKFHTTARRGHLSRYTDDFVKLKTSGA